MENSDLALVTVVQGMTEANIIKSALEASGIPVLLKYEAVGQVYAFTVDGLGEVKILVPKKHARRAWEIIEDARHREEEEEILPD